MPISLSQAKKTEIEGKTKKFHLCLKDKVLREVARRRTRLRCGPNMNNCIWPSPWLKNHVRNNYFIHFEWWRTNPSQFHMIIDDLQNIEVKIDDENNVISL